jgi:hypothetical protein
MPRSRPLAASLTSFSGAGLYCVLRTKSCCVAKMRQIQRDVFAFRSPKNSKRVNCDAISLADIDET